jgi:hypothetical protein
LVDVRAQPGKVSYAAPAGTPRSIINTLNATVARILAMPV